MIDALKPKPMNMYDNIPNKEDCIDIERTGFAPKGEYCDNCIYFRLEFETKISSWLGIIEKAVKVAKCSFFGSLLLSEEDKTPCGITYDRYKKCMDCNLQTDEKIIKQAKELGVSTGELVQTMKEMLVVNLMDNVKEEQK